MNECGGSHPNYECSRAVFWTDPSGHKFCREHAIMHEAQLAGGFAQRIAEAGDAYLVGAVVEAVPADKWAATVTDTPPVELTPGELALAFDVSRDGAWSTIAVAAGTVRSSYVEVIEQWHELTELREHPGHGRPLVAIEAPADGTTIELEDDRAAEAPIEFRGYMIERTAAAQADEGAWWVDDGMAVEFFDSPLDAAAFIGQREVAPSVVASIDANRWMEAERDVERAARERAETEARQLREAIEFTASALDFEIDGDKFPRSVRQSLLDQLAVIDAAVAEGAEDRGQTHTQTEENEHG